MPGNAVPKAADGRHPPNLTVSEVSSKMRAWPRRLEAQDTALSRPRHGFESRRGHPISWVLGHTYHFGPLPPLR
jgi:hypothetical protein